MAFFRCFYIDATGFEPATSASRKMCTLFQIEPTITKCVYLKHFSQLTKRPNITKHGINQE